MKTRNGFVSNSSSSSFIVALDKKPKTVDEVKKIFFPNDEIIRGEYYDYVLTAQEAATKIFNQLKNQRSISEKKILEEISYGWFEGFPRYDYDTSYQLENKYQVSTGQRFRDYDSKLQKYNEPVNKKLHAEISKKLNELGKKNQKAMDDAITKFYNKNKNKFKNKKVYVLSFGDNHGTEVCGIMEHGNAWDNVKHIVISHH